MGIRTRKKHPDKALNVVGIKALKKPGRYADGNGLYLKIDESGAKRWELRTVVRGKRCDIGLGGLKVVTLAEAREEARKYRAIARNEGDPVAEKRRARKVVPTRRLSTRNTPKPGRTRSTASSGSIPSRPMPIRPLATAGSTRSTPLTS
jgi:hypothetical protein